MMKAKTKIYTKLKLTFFYYLTFRPKSATGFFVSVRFFLLIFFLRKKKNHFPFWLRHHHNATTLFCRVALFHSRAHFTIKMNYYKPFENQILICYRCCIASAPDPNRAKLKQICLPATLLNHLMRTTIIIIISNE
jgi:hypothetical protein